MVLKILLLRRTLSSYIAGDSYSVYLHYKQLNLKVHHQNVVCLQDFWRTIKVLIEIK